MLKVHFMLLIASFSVPALRDRDIHETFPSARRTSPKSQPCSRITPNVKDMSRRRPSAAGIICVIMGPHLFPVTSRRPFLARMLPHITALGCQLGRMASYTFPWQKMGKFPGIRSSVRNKRGSWMAVAEFLSMGDKKLESCSCSQ